jgi:hypothetical protein
MPTFGRPTPEQPVRVFCEDESRLGLHLPLPRRLTGYGVQPVQSVAPLSEYSWLSAAVEPTPGAACWWELPCLEAAGFTVLLRQVRQH